MARVRHRVGIVGDVAEIFRALHWPEGLVGWWATACDGEGALGEQLNLHFGDAVTLSFRVEALEENAEVGLCCVGGPVPWLGSSLVFSLRADAEQVWLELVQENTAASEEDFLYFNSKWPCYLLSLRDHIEHGRGRPYPQDVKIHLGD